MTSHRRSRDRPIEYVELKINFRADRATSSRIRDAIPGAVIKAGGCEVKVEGERPSEVADRAHEILEKIRSVVEAPKGFK